MIKLEFSKLIFIMNTILVIAITLWGVWLFTEAVFREIMVDFTPAVTLIGAAFAEYGTCTAFYYNKAKAENRIKLKKKYKIKIDEEDL